MVFVAGYPGRTSRLAPYAEVKETVNWLLPRSIQRATDRIGILHKLAQADPETSIRVSTAKSHRWYDLSLRVTGAPKFERRFAGRIETGAWGFSDPRIGSA